MSRYEALVDCVLAIDNSKSRSDILLDLEYTKSVDETINRIFDNKFLDGVEGDSKETMVILDSDEEELNLPEIHNSNEDCGKKRIIKSPKRHISLESLEELSPIRYTNKKDEGSLDEMITPPMIDSQNNEEEFSYESLEIENRKRKYSPTSNSICLIDSDSEDSLPSVNDFLDQLMSREERETSEPIVHDRKGKKRAVEYNTSKASDTSSMDTLKDKIKEQKRSKQQLAEEKKQKTLELLEEKKAIKEKKAMEKERAALFEKENRIKDNRMDTIKEMIIDLHPDFIKTKAGELLKLLLEKNEITFYETTSDFLHHISWHRKCTSKWDNHLNSFIPLKETEIINEDFVLIYVDLQDFFKHIQQETLFDYVDTIKSYLRSNHQIIFLMEGLHAYYKKKINLERRLFDEQVRNRIEGNNTSASKRKIQPEIENGPSQKQIEDAMDMLMITKDIMFVLTKNDEDTVSWIECLTIEIAQGRYKDKTTELMYKPSKTCVDPKENYSCILQEIQLCTPAVATSIINKYPTLQSLHQMYTSTNKAEGEQLLTNLDVQRSAFIARDRKINSTMSKRIHSVFSGTDPNEIIL